MTRTKAFLTLICLIAFFAIKSANIVSVASGNWNTASTWSTGTVPTSADNVTISAGHNVTMNGNQGNCLSLIVNGTANWTQTRTTNVGTGGLFLNNGTISGSGTLLIAGTFSVTGNSTITSTSLNVTGVTFITGTIVFNSVQGTKTFSSVTVNSGGVWRSIANETQTVSGNFNMNGGTINGTATCRLIIGGNLNILSGSNILSRSRLNVNGTFAVSGTLTIVNTGGLKQLTNVTINPTGLWDNAVNESWRISGNFINNGLFNSGTGMYIFNGTNKTFGGGANSIFNGVVSVTGSCTNDGYVTINNSLTGAGSWAQGSGILDIKCTMANFNVATFSASGAGNTVIYSNAGSLTIRNPVGATYHSLTVSGGTKTLPATTTCNGNVTIRTATSLDVSLSNFPITVGGNWSDSGTFVPRTTTTTFNGTSAQTIFKSGGETFTSVIFSNTGIKTLLSPITTTANFTINTGSTLDVSTSNHQINIAGNFTNNGTLLTQKGKVHLKGTAAQIIGGTSVTNFYDLSLNNNAGASLSGAQNLIGTLTLSNGTFNVNGQTFTMISTASGTARVATITGSGDISGNVIAQRFAAGGTTGWTFWGSPLSSTNTFADLNDDFSITCSTCPNGWPGGFTSVYAYDETAPGLFDDANAYIGITSINNTIAGGKGYWVYLGNGQITTTAITAEMIGAVRKFNFTIPLTYTNTGSIIDDGWNLIANPYPSPIKWSLLKGTTPNIDNAIYTFNPDLNGGAGGYAAFVNGISSPSAGSGGITDTIPMYQGFYVHSTGATSLNATESNKVGGNPTFHKMISSSTANNSNQSLVRLKLNGNGYADETVLYEQAGASVNFEQDYDAIKMRGGDQFTAWISFESGGSSFQVNGVDPIQTSFSIPVKAVTGTSGNYVISATDLSTFDSSFCISLYDRVSGIFTDLRTGTCNFYLADTTASERFELHVSPPLTPLIISITQPTLNNPTAGVVVAKGAGAGPWNYYWKNVTGTVIKTTLNATGADTLTNVGPGSYSVQVNTAISCFCGETPFTINSFKKFSYVQTQKQVMIHSNTKPENYIVEVYDETGRLLKSEKINSQDQLLDLSGFSAGIYLMSFRSAEEIESHKLFID